MKKILYLMILALVPMAFAACGSDDDGGGSGVEGHDSRLVGTWYEYGDYYTAGIRFESDGTCYFGEWNNDQSPRWGSARQWETDANSYVAIGRIKDGELDVEIYRYEINGKNLNLYDEYDEGSGEFTHLEYKLVKQ